VPLAAAVTAMTEHTRAATNGEMIVRFFKVSPSSRGG
jgi:hypothetical protein